MRRAHDGPPDDAMAPIESFDHPAVAGVEAHVPRPPENVAGPHFVERHFGQLGRDCVGGSRQAHARLAPRALYEARTIEAAGARATPAVAFADLRPRGNRAPLPRRLPRSRGWTGRRATPRRRGRRPSGVVAEQPAQHAQSARSASAARRRAERWSRGADRSHAPGILAREGRRREISGRTGAVVHFTSDLGGGDLSPSGGPGTLLRRQHRPDAAHVAPFGIRTDANVAAAEGLNTGWVPSMKPICDAEQLPPATRLQPTTCESIAYLPLAVSGIYRYRRRPRDVIAVGRGPGELGDLTDDDEELVGARGEDVDREVAVNAGFPGPGNQPGGRVHGDAGVCCPCRCRRRSAVAGQEAIAGDCAASRPMGPR